MTYPMRGKDRRSIVMVFIDARTTLNFIVMLELCLGCRYESFAVCEQFITPLASNQVGLPAELKHINKRRKRN